MPPLVYARKTTSAIPIVGCYSDIEALESDGLIVGTGWFEIKKVTGKYVATFTELRDDGGEGYPEVKVKHLVVNKAKKVVVFDLALHLGGRKTVLKQVRGRISRAGIKMNWRGHSTDYGQSDPFMKREKCG